MGREPTVIILKNNKQETLSFHFTIFPPQPLNIIIITTHIDFVFFFSFFQENSQWRGPGGYMGTQHHVLPKSDQLKVQAQHTS